MDVGTRRHKWGAREIFEILEIFGFSCGAQGKAKARSNINNQTTVNSLGKGAHGKAPLGPLEETSAHQESWEVEGRMGAPRVTEALGTGWPLARDRMGDPCVKDIHPFKIPQPWGSHLALSPKKLLSQP